MIDYKSINKPNHISSGGTAMYLPGGQAQPGYPGWAGGKLGPRAPLITFRRQGQLRFNVKRNI